MDNFITFVTIIAWVVGIASTLFTFARIYAKGAYTDLGRSLDIALHGRVKTFPVVRPALLALVCWAWIIAFAS